MEHSDKSEEQIKLLQLDQSGIRAAAYLTELPPRRLLQRKLHKAILLARARLEEKDEESKNARRLGAYSRFTMAALTHDACTLRCGDVRVEMLDCKT